MTSKDRGGQGSLWGHMSQAGSTLAGNDLNNFGSINFAKMCTKNIL